MSELDRLHVFLSREVQELMLDQETSVGEILRAKGVSVEVAIGDNPAEDARGKKEPATILLASAAVLAVVTPLLREVIRSLARRDTLASELRLVPVQDSSGGIVRDKSGEPILHWARVSAATPLPNETTRIKGFGVEISFESR
jgi:hypothetical protein